MKAFFRKGIYGVCVMVLLLVILQGCNFRKYIPAESHLLSKVKIKGEPSTHSDEVYSLLKQTPNKRILGLFRVNMWSYLWADEAKIKERRKKKLRKLQTELSEQRKALASIQVTETKRQKQEYKVIKLENRTDRQQDKVDNLTRGVFEAPVLLDSGLVNASASQIQAFLFNKGYFHNQVTYDIRKRRQKAKVTYKINTGDAFKINTIDYLIYDSAVAPLVMNDSLKSEVHPGQNYDGDALARERERLYLLFRENGYYGFNREYIYYEVDSSLEGNFVNIGLAIANPPSRNFHRLYKLNNIYVEPEYILGDTLLKDTLLYNDLYFVSRNLHVKPSLLSDFILLHKNELFRASNYQNTLNKLAQLNLFRFVDIQFTIDTVGRKDTSLLNAFVRLTPLKKQEISTDLEFNYREEGQASIAISSNRSLGLAGSIVYRNKNLFKSGLQLEIRPRAALENPITDLQDARISYEYGVNTALVFPQLLWFWKIKDQKLRLNTQTALNLNFIFEENRYFNRSTFNTNLTYHYQRGKYSLFYTPVEISLVNTGFNSFAFENEVRKTRDPLLINLFDQHIITDTRIAFVNGQQPITSVRNFYWFFRNSLETGGNLMSLYEKTFDDKEEDNALTRKIYGINYYQYLRNEFDIRAYLPVWRENNLAFRGIFGFGLPYGNSSILPFERRFYVGGSNSIRAWRLRELGPGQFRDITAIDFDKSGDLKFEGSTELRFPVYGLFKSALFVDFGNVWTYKKDMARPGAQFKLDSALSQMAVGTGLGLRFDFTFFILRLDLAVPVRDPSLPVGQRYVLHNIRNWDWTSSNTRLQLGIGYPF